MNKGENEIKMGVDNIVDKEIREKHDSVGKGKGMIGSLREGLSFIVRGHNQRIHDCPPFSPWGDHELNP